MTFKSFGPEDGSAGRGSGTTENLDMGMLLSVCRKDGRVVVVGLVDGDFMGTSGAGG